MTLEPITSKQGFYLFTLTGYDVRGLSISKQIASDLIGEAKNGGLLKACQTLRDLGALKRKDVLDKNKKVVSKKRVSLKDTRSKNTESVDYRAIYDAAYKAGVDRAVAYSPRPMLVSGYGAVVGGVCGFAYIVYKPARGAWVKFLKDNDLGFLREAQYGGGWWYSIGLPNGVFEQGGTQSLERKEVFADGFTEYLATKGIKHHRVESRMD